MQEVPMPDYRESGPQPDPMLQEGRASSVRKWAVTAVIVVVLLAVMYGLTARRVGTQDQQRQSELQQTPAANSTRPGQALPGGRTTGNAPSTAAPNTSTQGPSQ
jgi:hypothetical protein